MNGLSDQQLLRDYTGGRSEAAFAELVRRHVDLVYCAAMRMIRDAHLAEDVTQSVFVALARNARQLTGRSVLSGWLHRTAQNIAAQTVRTDVRRRAREQEAAAMNELLATEPDTLWEQIAPHLDAALGELGKAPTLVVDKSFKEAKDKPDLSFATLIEPSGDITDRVIAALPKPDVKLDAAFTRLTYNHRSWRDGEMYFFFNESNKEESRMATIAGHGQAQVWDLATAEIHPISAATAEGDSVRVPLVLGP